MRPIAQPEYKQGDESSVKGVEALLGSGGVLRHDSQQGGELAVQLVPVVCHLVQVQTDLVNLIIDGWWQF